MEKIFLDLVGIFLDLIGVNFVKLPISLGEIVFFNRVNGKCHVNAGTRLYKIEIINRQSTILN